MNQRWCIFADIEGFRWFLEHDRVKALVALGELMRSIYRISRRCYPESPERLFAHQFGDGFFIASDFHETSLDRCVAIAIAIMRHVATRGCFLRVSIAEGELADIQGCYPDEVMSQCKDGHHVMMDGGIMTITPVMGTAFAHAVALAESGKPQSSGPLLVIRDSDESRIDSSIPRKPIPKSNLVAIDWVHAEMELLKSVQATAKLDHLPTSKLERSLVHYSKIGEVKSEWALNVESLLGVPPEDSPDDV